MNKFFITLGFFCSLSCIEAMAQDTLSVAPPRHIAQTILEKLDHEVDLNDAQEKKVYALLLERSEKFSQIRHSSKSKKSPKLTFGRLMSKLIAN